MIKPLLGLLATGIVLAMLQSSAPAGPMSAFDHEFDAIEGGKLPLAQWRGKVLLIVNTASFDLQELSSSICLAGVADETSQTEVWAAARIARLSPGHWRVHLARKARQGQGWRAVPQSVASGMPEGQRASFA
jgi:hypothetical protein